MNLTLKYTNLFFLFIVLILISLESFSQNKSKEDSLLFELAESKNDSDKVFVLLDIAKYYSKTDIVRTEGFTKQALRLSEELNYELGEAKANYYLANIFRTFDSELAQQFIIKALEQAQKLDDKLFIADCYNLIGIIIALKKQMNEDAIIYHKKALKIRLELNDSTSIAQSYNNIGVVYGHLKKDTLALEHFFKAAKLNNEYNNYLWLTINYTNIGRLVYFMDSIPEAFNYFGIAEKMINEHNFNSNIPWLYNNFAYSYFDMGEYDKAFFYADSAYNYSRILKNTKTLETAIALLQNIHEKTGDINKAYLYSNELIELKDTIHKKEREDKIKLMELRFIFEKEQSILQLKNKNSLLKLWIAIVGLFLVVFSLYILLRLQKTKTKNTKLAKSMLALETDNLNKELDLRNRELTSKIISLIDKSKLIDNVIEKLTHNELNFKTENKKHIQSLVSSLRIHQKSDMWSEFETTFTAIHPAFYKRLQDEYPTLTNKELRLCAYLKLNMSSKEISNLMHLNINSVETARSRLRKKLNITGSDISLYTFIAKF